MKWNNSPDGCVFLTYGRHVFWYLQNSDYYKIVIIRFSTLRSFWIFQNPFYRTVCSLKMRIIETSYQYYSNCFNLIAFNLFSPVKCASELLFFKNVHVTAVIHLRSIKAIKPINKFRKWNQMYKINSTHKQYGIHNLCNVRKAASHTEWIDH